MTSIKSKINSRGNDEGKNRHNSNKNKGLVTSIPGTYEPNSGRDSSRSNQLHHNGIKQENANIHDNIENNSEDSFITTKPQLSYIATVDQPLHHFAIKQEDTTNGDMIAHSSRYHNLDLRNSNETSSCYPTNFEYPTSYVNDSVAFEDICSIVDGYPGQVALNNQDESLFTVMLNMSNKRLSQLQALVSDSNQVLDNINSQKSKLREYIKSMNTENSWEHSVSSTSVSQLNPLSHAISPYSKKDSTNGGRKLSIQPDSDSAVPRKRQKQREQSKQQNDLGTSTIGAKQTNSDMITELKLWCNTTLGPQCALLPNVNGHQIRELHSKVRKALVEKAKMNDHPILAQNRSDLKTVQLNYADCKVAPVKEQQARRDAENRQYNSALLTSVTDGFDGNTEVKKFKDIHNFLMDLKQQSPDSLVDFVKNYRPGKTTNGLGSLKNTCLDWMEKSTYDHELIWLIYLEITLYQYGRSTKLDEVGAQALKIFPWSIHISWQLIRGYPHCSTRHKKTVQLLQRMKTAGKSGKNGPNLTNCSLNTREILLRTLRHDGLHLVLRHLIPESSIEHITQAQAHPRRSIKIPPPTSLKHIHLTDSDFYYLWISIIMYYLTRRLPHQLYGNHHWLARIGKRKIAKQIEVILPLGIDWTSLKHAPLSTEEQFVVVSILLGLLKYFNTKASSDNNPETLKLRASVIWTLVGLIDQLDSN